jgi:hypothetical protein
MPADEAVADRSPGAADPDETVLSTRPGDGSLPRDEANKDEVVRRWDQVTPSATLIGRAESPDADLSETIRRLHDERHQAMAGHADRMHRLDKVRIAHAICSHLDVTGWERDRTLGVMAGLELTPFGSQHAVEKVALVVVQHVVDRTRRRRLGLHDQEWVRSHSPERMAALYDRFESLTDDDRYRELLDAHDLTITSVNRLDRILQEQLPAQGLTDAVLGRSRRDPTLPALADRGDEADTAR